MNDGGPAFPTIKPGNYHSEDGMSLRDYFAAHATKEDLMAYRGESEYGRNPDNWAESKFRYADDMLKAREKKS